MSARRRTARTGSPLRLRRRLALAAAALSLTLITTPGTASAATASTVTPILDCYTQNSDGSWTVILGYTNTYSVTTKIPLGSNNIASPSKFQGLQPTAFKTGANHAVFTVRVTQADLYANANWYLDGHTLNYLSAAYASGICSPGTQLPGEGNGTGIAIGLVVAAGIGVLVVRRVIRRAGTQPVAPGEPGHA
jgi:hypothetical protein